MSQNYYSEKGWAIPQWVAPDGVIALDFDAPTKEYGGGWLQELFRDRVEEQCKKLAKKYGLGRHWTYETGSPGLHVIFEHPIENDQFIEVFMDATDPDFSISPFYACSGHACVCVNNTQSVLRVGHKPDRAWDIIPLSDGADAPPHVVEHDRLLALKLMPLEGG